MKVIETQFAGRLFRSRLEARWAIFFKTLGVVNEYEPEAYDLGDGLSYLPDFWLPEQACFFEIKPEAPKQDGVELEKARRLSVHTMRRVIMYVGSPRLIAPGSGAEFPKCVFPNGEDFPYLWCECPRCGRIDLQFDGRSDRINCRCDKNGARNHTHASNRLLLAYETATSHRFWSPRS